MDLSLNKQEIRQLVSWSIGALVAGILIVVTGYVIYEQRQTQNEVRQAAEEMQRNCKYVGYSTEAVPDRIFSCNGKLISEKEMVNSIRGR